ncbi:pyridoxal-phosphate-dependent aminotransferase family protein [Thiorhodovibrio frisius]|nr:aminotransferase class V-fold PLP-dependent enzyme [Thiorhodovibrio frisius]WPL23484.1 Soluble hydrogenase 42 kDa subunit [Thiorhodovibrio frisius]
MSEDTRQILGAQTPYFRTPEFSQVVLECERLLVALVGAPSGSRAVFLTASGTAAMEAGVINLLGSTDSALVVNGGSFGQRFCDICRCHGIPHRELRLSGSDPVPYPGTGARALLLNGHETSTGRCYDLDESGAYCRRHGMLHLVDAISLFVTDELNMASQAIDVLVLSSHKGLALAPGLAMVVLAPTALAVLKERVPSFYLDFHPYLNDGIRGQTPFTPAVGILLALLQRLRQIHAEGVSVHIDKARALAAHFRAGIRGLPLRLHASPAPNAMTALERTDGGDARDLVVALKQRHGLVLTPNGGALAARVFRVSHMGEQRHDRLAALLVALHAYFNNPR